MPPPRRRPRTVRESPRSWAAESWSSRDHLRAAVVEGRLREHGRLHRRGRAPTGIHARRPALQGAVVPGAARPADRALSAPRAGRGHTGAYGAVAVSALGRRRRHRGERGRRPVADSPHYRLSSATPGAADQRRIPGRTSPGGRWRRCHPSGRFAAAPQGKPHRNSGPMEPAERRSQCRGLSLRDFTAVARRGGFDEHGNRPESGSRNADLGSCGRMAAALCFPFRSVDE